VEEGDMDLNKINNNGKETAGLFLQQIIRCSC
jgi:hypothetical protein